MDFQFIALKEKNIYIQGHFILGTTVKKNDRHDGKTIEGKKQQSIYMHMKITYIDRKEII